MVFTKTLAPYDVTKGPWYLPSSIDSAAARR